MSTPPGRSVTRRSELSDFLRTRRERITPDDVGLPSGGRRRTPGLRREEVALLAGVGVTWYTWLEQGRDINASVQVLEAIARTLRMDSQERWHLFQLAGVTIVPPARDCPRLDGPVQDILNQLDPFPAAVLSARYDILAYNRGFNWVMGDIDSIAPGERNSAWLFFTHDYWQSMCLNRSQAGRHIVANMRAALAQHVEDPLWASLVQRLREASAEFDSLWRRHEIFDVAMPAKEFGSPVGDLHFESSRLELGQNGSRLLIYTPSDDVTRARLQELVTLGERRGLHAV